LADVVTRKTRFSTLQEEMGSIRVADELYLERREGKNRDMLADYQLRQERLKGIKTELAQLRD
jgi:hypothetical protein